MKITNIDIEKNIIKYAKENHKYIGKKQLKSIIKIFNNTKNELFKNVTEINTIGIGGNGIVFDIKSDDKDSLCLKCLYNQQNGRAVRFNNEIKAMKLLNGIDGVLPIISDGADEDLDYYFMPRCEKYVLSNEKPFINKINDLLNIANTIKDIHNSNNKITAHRDIKVDNILYKDGKIYLSDFGLVKMEDNDNITKEPIGGPRIISPPEFYQIIPNWNYHFSDVYLFSKVVWQILFNKEHGFWGEYTVSQDNYIGIESIEALNLNETILTVEPINEMLINTTCNNFNHRIKYDINYCIKMLTEEKNILINNGVDVKKTIYKDNTNWIKFFNHGNTSIVSFEPEVISVIKILMKNSEIKKNLKYYSFGKKISEMFLTVKNASFSHDLLYIELYNNCKIIGKIRYIISDNQNMEIILMFNNYINNESAAKRIENYDENDGEYLLDGTSEIIISFD